MVDPRILADMRIWAEARFLADPWVWAEARILADMRFLADPRILPDARILADMRFFADPRILGTFFLFLKKVSPCLIFKKQEFRENGNNSPVEKKFVPIITSLLCRT